MPITANLMGRLGNQMFQIATAHSLALDHGDKALFPLVPQGTAPQPHEQLFYANTIFSNVTYEYDFSWIKSVYNEISFRYTKIPYSKGTLINGYFQSEKYFVHNRKEIKNLFNCNDFIEKKLEKYSHICSDKYVAIHIRRGDYLQQSDTHTNLGEHTQYYQEALKHFEGKTKIFFSDDIEWCKSVHQDDSIFIENENDVVELFLFSRIPNKIIANSSFSWWAAWLGDYGSSVVAPSKWFGPKNSHLDCSDVIPERWVRI